MSQIDELRQIINGDNAELIQQLKERVERLDKRTQDVADVLPSAINAGVRDDNGLIDSLKQPVSIGLKEAIRSETEEYAEILYPAIAPSIRLAISQAISSMLVTINRTLESATTAEGLRLRMESLRTGVPYAELALRRSVLFRVEHVYLIDRETGMSVNNVSAEDAKSLDSDAVSAMFSAIQSFVQDSFARDESARLTDLKVGGHNVWVAHGRKLMLACVIFGEAPESLKNRLYDTLDSVRTDYAVPIEQFNGDASAFIGVDSYIEPLLQLQEYEEEEAAAENSHSWIPFLIIGLLCVGLIAYYFHRHVTVSTVEHYLNQAPGIAVTDVFYRDGHIVVEGLQDPDAEIPYSILAAHDVQADDLLMQTIPFRSLEPEMELQRFKKEFELPSGIRLEKRNGAVYLIGQAPIQWLLKNDTRLRQLQADKRLNLSALSASKASILALLRANFSASTMQSITVLNVDYGNLAVVEVDDRVNREQMTVLNVMFAGNIWVDIRAVVADQ